MSGTELLSPTYDRADVRVGIAHIGVGNFHRSHQAMYLDTLMQRGEAMEWGICGIGLMPYDMRMRDALTAQEYRYTLVEKFGDGSLNGRTIGSIVDYRYAPDDPAGVLDLLSSESIRIVSLTITEGGYNIDRSNGDFMLDTPAIQHDLEEPERPTTAFGFITEALRRRRESGVAPFTVVSCDNLPGNGHIARQAVVSFAAARDRDLASWIDTHVAFPNSMVDRITPVTTDADRALVRETFGIDDRWPVMTEPFTQWVLEDIFTMGRPPLEHVGVQIVADVVPYELMKLRLLNATHQAMAYIGMLAGYTYVHEAVGDGDLTAFLRAHLAEARATLPPVPGIDLDAYEDELFVRFGNRFIADTLARLAADASDRIPKFVLPTLRDNLAAGRSVRMGVALLASWARYLQVTEESRVVDALKDTLLLYASAALGDPAAFLSCPDVFGDLGQQPVVVSEFSAVLTHLQSETPQEVIRRLVSEP